MICCKVEKIILHHAEISIATMHPSLGGYRGIVEIRRVIVYTTTFLMCAGSQPPANTKRVSVTKNTQLTKKHCGITNTGQFIEKHLMTIFHR